MTELLRYYHIWLLQHAKTCNRATATFGPYYSEYLYHELF